MKKFAIIVFILACLSQKVFCGAFDGVIDYFNNFTKNCCKAHDNVNLGFICDDGKYAPFSGCCGVGSCNTVCCNCDGGCRTGEYPEGNNPFGWPSGSISSNFGISGIGQGVPVSDIAKEAGKVVASNAGKFGLAVKSDLDKRNKK